MRSSKPTPPQIMSTNLDPNRPLHTQEEWEASWGINEPLRLPTGNYGWDAFNPRSVMEEISIRAYANNYASIVGVPSKHETLHRVAALINEFPLDFKTAADSISREGWRTLYYSGTYVLGCLAAYNFHANQELRHICDIDEFTDGLPTVWIGGAVEPRVVAQQTQGILQEIGSEPSKAAYSILAAAQRISLSRSEILRCEWWSPSWIQNLSARLNAGR